jgi:uncharacterized protein YjbI with pentapeptide repeats
MNLQMPGAYLLGVDLRDAHLGRAFMSASHLREANLEKAYLEEAEMHDVDFNYANLRQANLRYGVFSGSNFEDADLAGANLMLANLDSTNFDRARLAHANLNGCSFAGATFNATDFSNAVLGGTVFSDVDLSHATGLDRCVHSSASILDHTHSIKSDWVEDEVTKAFEEERKRGQTVLFPIRLDDAVMDTNEPWAAKLRARHIGDFRRWKEHDEYQKSFARVLRDLAVKKD